MLMVSRKKTEEVGEPGIWNSVAGSFIASLLAPWKLAKQVSKSPEQKDNSYLQVNSC